MKRLIIFLFMFIFSLNSIYAIEPTSDDKAYWTYDLNSTDVINLIGLTSSGDPQYVEGKINNATELDGTGDYWTTNSNPYDINTNDFSISFWVNATDATPAVQEFILGNRYTQSGTDNKIAILLNTDGTLAINNKDTSQANFNTAGTISTGWNHIVLTRSGTTWRTYINNANETHTGRGGDISANQNWVFGDSDASTEFDGRIDEIFITGYQMTTQNVSDLYNSGNGLQYPFDLSPTITSNITNGGFYNVSTIAVQLTAGFNTNMSYVLNSGNETSVCSNCTTGNLNLTGVEGLNNVTWISTVGVSQTNTSESFTIDTISPSINVTNNTGQTNYQVNFSNFVSCSDTNLLYCNVSVDDGSNFNLSSPVHTFITSGNHTFNVTAVDLAGNSLTLAGYNVFVNPNRFYYFQNNITSSLISDYSVFDGTTEYTTNNTLLTIPTYSLGLGNTTLTFVKDGFETTNFTTYINLSNSTNLTTIINPVTLTIKIYEFETTNQLTFNVTIDNGSLIKSYTNELNFSEVYEDLPTGDIEMIVTSQGYSEAYFYNTLNPMTSITVTGYLFNESVTSTHTFTVQDITTGEPLEDVLIEIQRIINDTYTTISQRQTESNGIGAFALDSSKTYKVIFTKDGYVSATATTIPSITSYSVNMQQTSTAFEYINSISYSITPTGTYLNDNTTYNFTGFISDTSFSLTEFSIYWNNGSLIYNASSTNPTGTTFKYEYFIPDNVSSDIYINLSYLQDGIRNDIIKQYEVISFTNTSFFAVASSFAEDDSEESRIFRWLMVMICISSLLIWGTTLGAREINIFAIPLLMFFALVSWIDWTTTALLSFIALVTFMGGKLR